ncbi:MAG: hypothetical protein AB7L94_24905 [Kofleriaceae bacterium]
MASLALVGCSTVPNPLYCDEDLDCNNGERCNLDVNGCEAVVPVDALHDAPDDGPEMDGPYIAKTVREVRAATTPVDTFVELTGVVVTAVDKYGPRTGDFWVQDAGGGPMSGVHIYSAIASEVAQLVPGDIVDIGNARKVLFTIGGDTSGRSEIELMPRVGGNIVLTKTGATTPVSTDIDVAAIATLAQPELDEELENWAGMLVRATFVDADGEPMLMTGITQFPLGPFFVQDTQVQLPSGIVAGTCFVELVGIVEYARNYNLVPRQASDMTISGTCP